MFKCWLERTTPHYQPLRGILIVFRLVCFQRLSTGSRKLTFKYIIPLTVSRPKDSYIKDIRCVLVYFNARSRRISKLEFNWSVNSSIDLNTKRTLKMHACCTHLYRFENWKILRVVQRIILRQIHIFSFFRLCSIY